MSTKDARRTAIAAKHTHRHARVLLHAIGTCDEDGHCPLTHKTIAELGGGPPKHFRERVLVPLIEDGWLLSGSFARCIVLNPSIFKRSYARSDPCPFEREHERYEVDWKRKRARS